MNRIVGVMTVASLLLGALALSVPSVRTVARGNDASPVETSFLPTPQSPLAAGLPAGVTFDELVSGQVDDLPDAPAVLRLERHIFAPDAATGGQKSLGPEILYVETGEIRIADEFGFESALTAGDGVMLNAGSGYELTNDGGDDAVVLRLRVLSTDDAEKPASGDDDEAPAATPVVGPGGAAEPAVETLLEGEIDDSLPEPGVVFLARTTWEPGADSGEFTQTGPLGLLVESGTMTVTSPSGIEGQVRKGRGIVLPADVPLRARNAESEQALALVVGVVPAGGALIAPVVPSATPTSEPTATLTATSTSVPTPTVPPTPTSEPTAPSEPTSIPTPTPRPTTAQGTILQMGQTWEVAGASLTVQVGDVKIVRRTLGGNYYGVHIGFNYRNLSDSRVDFLIPDGFIDIHDDLRVPWQVESGADLRGRRVILEPDESFAGGWDWLPSDVGLETHAANVFVTFRNFGAIPEAKWGFTIANGRILTLPPDAVDPTAARADDSESAAIRPVAGNQGDDTEAAQDPAYWAWYYSTLEATRDFETLYEYMHPDAKAVVPRKAVVGWYRDAFYTSVSEIQVLDVTFIGWTWPVTGETYPRTAEVTYIQTVSGASGQEAITEVVRLVEACGQWRWFFGRSWEFVSQQIALYGGQPQTSAC